MARPGRIKLEEIKLEGGIVVPVYLHKETGVFSAEYVEEYVRAEADCELHTNANEHWSGKDLEKLREDVRRWAREKKQLQWEPVIVLYSGVSRFTHHGRTVLGNTFERLMRGKKLHGDGYEWRQWGHQKSARGGFIYDTDLEVVPPSGRASEPMPLNSGEAEPQIIAYRPERWSALLKLVEMETALRERLTDIIGAGEAKIDALLTSVREGGLLALMGPKEGK
jgi:hypothetical protein